MYIKLVTLLFFPILTFGQIPQDKQKHFFVGAGIGAVAYAVTYSQTHNKTKAATFSIISSFAAGTIKELIDMKNPNNFFDTGDLVMTGLGGIAFNITIDLKPNKKPRRFRRGNTLLNACNCLD